MFTRVSATVPAPFERIHAALLTRSWFFALNHEEATRLNVVALGERLRLEVGRQPVETGAERALWPLRVRPASGSPLLPRLEGHLVVEKAGRSSRLTLAMTYDPPLGGPGDVGGREFLHRMAEESLQELVERIALEIGKSLESKVASGPRK